jgi:hypothetical protein
MIIRLILLIIAIQTISSGIVVVSQAINECERRLPNSYTKPQKQQLCRKDDSLGPAICASLAKQILHVKFEVILELCQDATSSAPVQCMSSLVGLILGANLALLQAPIVDSLSRSGLIVAAGPICCAGHWATVLVKTLLTSYLCSPRRSIADDKLSERR